MASERTRALRFVPAAEVDAMDALRAELDRRGWTVEIGYGSGGMMGVLLSLDGLYGPEVDTKSVYSLAHGYSGEWGLGKYASLDALGWGAHVWWENHVAPCPTPITVDNIGAAALVDAIDEVINRNATP